jgi:2-hydroxy-4-carboxymuconate semialdehyde hemiacetal dehydrogenase
LTLGAVYPLRMRADMVELKKRVMAGEESVRQVCGRFYIYRLENVGATGYRRSWTDNLLWHHTSHLVDFGLWLLDTPVRRVSSHMPPLDAHTGIPMELFLGIETVKDQQLITSGSYYGRERVWETFVITDKDSYRIENFTTTMMTGAGPRAIVSEKENCMQVARDFVAAVRKGRQPAIPGEAVLPSLRVLQEAQDQWDAIHGKHSIPGRELR